MEDLIKLDGIFEQGYGFIAKKVMQDTTLPLATKGFYAYLCSFGGKGNDVFPSRKKICTDLDIGNDTLSKYISLLVEKGYIQVITTRTYNGRFNRNTYKIMLSPCSEKPNTEKTNTEKLNTNNNIVNNNNINNIVVEYTEQIDPTPSTFIIDKLLSYADDLPEEVILEAIKIAVEQNAKNFNYIEAILKRCITQKITKAEDVRLKKKNIGNKEEGTSYLKQNGLGQFDDLYEN